MKVHIDLEEKYRNRFTPKIDVAFHCLISLRTLRLCGAFNSNLQHVVIFPPGTDERIVDHRYPDIMQ